ncbi:hypothetical protein Gorai_006252, partial [Gossypium raimondii]|nr:hypothetical protein [Gossypium raimondii]
MAIVVIGSCPGLLLCVGVWVCAMAGYSLWVFFLCVGLSYVVLVGS